jgi:hypothetical protein
VPRRRRRRWWLIPAGLLLLVAFTLGWFYLHGTQADTQPLDPDRPDQPVSQLLRTPDGQTTVRAAVLIEQPRSKVWRVVTDFAGYDRFLPYLRAIEVEPGPGGTTRMTGEAKSALSGWWPFTIDIHTDRSRAEWRVWWDEKSDTLVQANRGGWALSEPAPGRTLLVLTLDTEVRGYPAFVIRGSFRDRLREVLRAVGTRLAEEED